MGYLNGRGKLILDPSWDVRGQNGWTMLHLIWAPIARPEGEPDKATCEALLGAWYFAPEGDNLHPDDSLFLQGGLDPAGSLVLDEFVQSILEELVPLSVSDGSIQRVQSSGYELANETLLFRSFSAHERTMIFVDETLAELLVSPQQPPLDLRFKVDPLRSLSGKVVAPAGLEVWDLLYCAHLSRQIGRLDTPILRGPEMSLEDWLSVFEDDWRLCKRGESYNLVCPTSTIPLL